MGLYERWIAPRLIACACSARTIARQRAKIVPLASGRVLELGMGAGANLAFYDPSKVTSVSAVEPNAIMREKARLAASRTPLTLDLHEGVGESLPFETQIFDCVVCTYTLCTVADVAKTLAEARRVLKPKGRLLFCEHGIAPDAEVARWQKRLEPIWTPIGAGCRLTRDPVAALVAAGFTLAHLDAFYLPKTPRPMGWTSWGEAI